MVGFVVLLTFCIFCYQSGKASSENDDIESEETMERLHAVFSKFDADGTGIEKDEVAIMCAKIDDDITQKEIDHLFNKADTDGSGVIDFKEFYAAVISTEKKSRKEAKKLDLKKLVEKKRRTDIASDATGRLFLLVFLLYPGLTNKIFEAFMCRSLSADDDRPEAVLAVDYSVDCNSTEYTVLTGWCFLLMVVWPLGLPVILFCTMHRSKKLILEEDEDTMQKFDFVLGDYLPQKWYWEVVELFRKLVLSGLIGLFGRGTIGQSFFATICCFIFFALSFKHWPFNTMRLNVIKVASEFQLFCILLICTILQTADTDEELFNPHEPDCTLEHNAGSPEDTFCQEQAARPWHEQAGLSQRTIETKDGYGTLQTVLTLAILPLTFYFIYQGMQDAREEAKKHSEMLAERKEMGGAAAVAMAALSGTGMTMGGVADAKRASTKIFQEFHNPLEPTPRSAEEEEVET
jgi:hypothetical protein